MIPGIVAKNAHTDTGYKSNQKYPISRGISDIWINNNVERNYIT